MTLEEVLEELRGLAEPEKVLFKQKKFGVIANNSLGVYQRDLNALARRIKKNDQLALELFDTGLYEARVLCSKIYSPKNVTSDLMEKWVVTFENWEICDSFSMALFAKSPLAMEKIDQWIKREREFEKRAGFATIAALCMADKKAPNDVFENFLNYIEQASNDNRLYVKKAVNWALRNIGKRNPDLNKAAISTAQRILEQGSQSARWIAQDALRELSKPDVRMSDYPRHIYRP
ncbi:MAG: DNA alkylation repair protein [Bacteroidia bacterium]|nr:DNA alkylation repair protein [Bacteroidia bacterium]